jgi:hypothetical protein
VDTDHAQPETSVGSYCIRTHGHRNRLTHRPRLANKESTQTQRQIDMDTNMEACMHMDADRRRHSNKEINIHTNTGTQLESQTNGHT